MAMLSYRSHYAPASEDQLPDLPLQEWQPTYATLHMFMQVVGKIRLAQMPFINHWWQVPLYLTGRGLTTSPVPYGERTFQIDFDFIDHRLVIATSEGENRSLALEPMTVARFYRAVMAALDSLGMPVSIWTQPMEVADPIPFELDELHRDYDPEYARRHWRLLAWMEPVFQRFRGDFLGKCSPVHFFWGGFDLAVTRFSGRRAPEHPPSPFIPLSVVREAYSHEVSSCGFWAGGGPVPEPAFYAYAYPEPVGFRDWPLDVDGAYYSEDLKEFILPYASVRKSENPEETLMRFLQATYRAAADLAGWDRGTLERAPEGAPAGIPVPRANLH